MRNRGRGSDTIRCARYSWLFPLAFSRVNVAVRDVPRYFPINYFGIFLNSTTSRRRRRTACAVRSLGVGSKSTSISRNKSDGAFEAARARKIAAKFTNSNLQTNELIIKSCVRTKHLYLLPATRRRNAETLATTCCKCSCRETRDTLALQIRSAVHALLHEYFTRARKEHGERCTDKRGKFLANAFIYYWPPPSPL